ncbi:MAG: tol-pal system protein YbgF, partial [Myxococcota bacterium]|nr:tol-pal system protein YbgF [Myxococcota bacterium]
ADPEDTTPRPTIRVFGSGRGTGRSGWHGEDRIEHVVPEDPSGAAEGAAGAAGAARPLDPEAKRAYDAALILVNARRCDRALDALASFLVKWPDHPYADNAMYWRGECYFARADYERASEQFEGVLARYPAGNKAPDALLKLGVCQQKLGDGAKAKASFDRLAEQYPQSDAARRISQAPGLGAATAPVGTTAPPAPGPQDRRP